MNTWIKVVLFAAALTAAGCRAAVDGNYAPGCIAFAGSNVELHNGRFVWDRFTDQIEIDANGNAVDPFPGYPISGDFTIDEEHRVSMTSDDGNAVESMYLYEIDGNLRLLTEDQNNEWSANGSVDNCALQRQQVD